VRALAALLICGQLTQASVLLPEEFSQAPPDPKGRHVMHNEVAERLEREASLMSNQETPVEPHEGGRDV
jgi:hypothetical protein